METLNRYFRDLTKAAFARHGFAQADLIGVWPEIVGAHTARMCRPERIRWPRGDGDGEGRQGGTLILQAMPGRALDIQHHAPHILERINVYFGYGAIASIKIVQTVWNEEPASPPSRVLPGDKSAELDRRLADCPDPGLREALRRLGHGALARDFT
jgi:hypothetical protein